MFSWYVPRTWVLYLGAHADTNTLLVSQRSYFAVRCSEECKPWFGRAPSVDGSRLRTIHQSPHACACRLVSVRRCNLTVGRVSLLVCLSRVSGVPIRAGRCLFPKLMAPACGSLGCTFHLSPLRVTSVSTALWN